jgi:hypothetical protein
MSNDINKPSVHFNDVLKEAIDNPSRRHILRGGLGLGALSFFLRLGRLWRLQRFRSASQRA